MLTSYEETALSLPVRLILGLVTICAPSLCMHVCLFLCDLSRTFITDHVHLVVGRMSRTVLGLGAVDLPGASIHSPGVVCLLVCFFTRIFNKTESFCRVRHNLKMATPFWAYIGSKEAE